MQAAESGPAASAATAAREAAKKGTATVDLQKLVEQVTAQREKMIADHDALARQLKQATDEQRKAILAQMHEQKKEFEAAQSALHKQIRDEQRRLRQNIGKR
jgi:biopolymer transport protein ExbB/TolQ